jgi:hypothetical protein
MGDKVKTVVFEDEATGVRSVVAEGSLEHRRLSKKASGAKQVQKVDGGPEVRKLPSTLRREAEEAKQADATEAGKGGA